VRPARPTLTTDLLMLLAAMIWGSTFVAQNLGMNGVGPFFYTGSRFLLGALLVLPLWRRRPAWLGQPQPAGQHGAGGRKLWLAGLGLGLVLFAGVNAQQVGLLGTRSATPASSPGCTSSSCPSCCWAWANACRPACGWRWAWPRWACSC
jgi:drug/metabolite transporter (DMT)-like permease